MKEKYIAPAYGLGNWRKTDVFSRHVYDFSDSKSWIDHAIEFATWSGILAILTLVVFLFV